MDPVSQLENALGAELLRVRLLGRAPPTIDDRYTIEEILGRGASGLVVAGVDVRLHRPVALKLRPVEGDSSALAEARTLARLDHPNVVRVHDVDIAKVTLDGREFQVWVVSMPRVDGRTMRAWLREAPRTTDEILAVLVDVARGLASAHAERIVHRDVKPENVLVRRDGVAQVVDFGFAVQTAPAQSALGGVHPAAGTDPYMAPEARLGRTSRSSDQFSLGITLVEALTGRPIPAGTRVPRDVSPHVWRIAQRATSPDPEERFPDLAAMVVAMTEREPEKRVPRTIPVLLAVTFAGVAAVAWTQRPSPQRAPSPDAPVRRAPLVDAGAPDAGLLSRPDAGASVTPTVDASVARCRTPTGRYRFLTLEESADGHPGRQGAYTMGVDVRGGRVADVSLQRTAPARDQLEVRRFVVERDCTLHLEAHAENRDYAFELAIEGRAVHGTFRTSRGASYAGRVVPETP